MSKIEVDASAIERLTGISVGTLNVWISRNLLPEASANRQGRARRFDEVQARHLTIMAALVRLGYPAPFASMAAFQTRFKWQKPGVHLVIGQPQPVDGAPLLSSLPTVDVVVVKPTDALSSVPLESFTVVKVDRIVERVRKFMLEANARSGGVVCRSP